MHRTQRHSSRVASRDELHCLHSGPAMSSTIRAHVDATCRDRRCIGRLSEKCIDGLFFVIANARFRTLRLCKKLFTCRRLVHIRFTQFKSVQVWPRVSARIVSHECDRRWHTLCFSLIANDRNGATTTAYACRVQPGVSCKGAALHT